MLSELVKKQLSKAGWYEGRKIDLTKYEEGYSKLGCELFPAARKFLEEFGDLDIQDKYIDSFFDINGNKNKIIYENRSIIDVIHCCSRRNNELEEKVEQLFGQKTLRVGLINYGNIYIHISEDGKFYTDWYNVGLRAENSDQLWNEYYGDECGCATWDELKAGKGRTMKKKEVKKYL